MYCRVPSVSWPYERANLESFLEAHVRAFEYFGSAPAQLAYDNLKCAVIQVKRRKKRRLNRRFKELRSWYLFDTRFCNVARGNEKGDVENLAKRFERTYLTPKPQVGVLAELGHRADGRTEITDIHHKRLKSRVDRILRNRPEFDLREQRTSF